MQHHKQTIQLSDHVKNKIKYHQPTPLSRSSNELTTSDNTDDDNEIFISSSPQKFYRKRSLTFTTDEVLQPSKSEYLLTDKKNNFQQNRILQRQTLCQQCIRYKNLLHNEHQYLFGTYQKNRKLTEDLRSTISLNHQYQKENAKLKQHLTKLNAHLEEYKRNFNLLKQKIILEKTNQSKQEVEVDQLKRLRHELHVYQQVIASKRQEEEKNIDYYSGQDWI
ncbi:unnamed protein product [Rotaria sordida]|uniref:Uncharacterized protein n=1 Tax=Rotaria sordida TaxID=392033 RepID=A0A813T3H5_9BILA|nr:unnamed protein product [Rotaria sordida]CAF0805927.1 unnamed protein product [Rotaria sordida]CAF0811434.1 unnamed protein product [Rotaria sordida]CAF3573327.1 unnamed protein product [Rotaria sordida]